MRTLRVIRGIGSAVAACTALTLLSGCGGASAESGAGGTFLGPSQPLGNGTVRTYVVPEGYVVPPGGTAAEQAVPGMGVHLVDSSDTSLVPGSYDFEQIVINGTWDGRHTFIEPMITREWLLTGPSLEQTLKLPQAYQRAGYHPTTYAVHVDEQTKDYVITMGGMTMRVAS